MLSERKARPPTPELIRRALLALAAFLCAAGAAGTADGRPAGPWLLAAAAVLAIAYIAASLTTCPDPAERVVHGVANRRRDQCICGALWLQTLNRCSNPPTSAHRRIWACLSWGGARR